MVNHFVDDEHFCFFDDMYSPEYSLQWIYEDIMKYDIGEESRKLLEEGHKEILQSECYQEYGYPSYIDRYDDDDERRWENEKEHDTEGCGDPKL